MFLLSPPRSHVAAALLGVVALHAPALAQYQLAWEDNFDGNTLDLARWEPQIGTGCPSLCGWGNNELQYYRAENATVGGGTLTITAREQFFGGAQYTSARLRTRNLGDWKYGRFEMRAKLPIGQGIWPAFWMFPTDEVHGTWAASGEIDIMEYIGQDPDRVFGTIHYGDSWPGNVFSGGGYTLPGSDNFNDDFHVFAVEWDEFEIRWYVDGVLFSTKTSWWSSGGPYPAPFNERFHLLLNMAVGGNLPGPPDGTTVFPQTYEIDYVRVYQQGDAPCVQVFDDMEHGNPFGTGYFVFQGGGSGGTIAPEFGDLPPLQGEFASLAADWDAGGSSGFLGGFGRPNPMDLTTATHFDMWIHPDAGQDYTLEINLQDDDDGNDTIPGVPDGADDEFQYELQVSPTGPGAISGGGWQQVSIPLASFVDDSSFHFGGNGVFDPTPVAAGGNGRLVNVVFALISSGGDDISFRSDLWSFTRRTSGVTGRVWNDLDGDGFDFSEPGLEGVTVELFEPAQGFVVASDVTDGAGEYTLDEVYGGSFVVRVDTTTLPAGAQATFDPDGIATPHEFALELACDEVSTFQHFGYEPGAVTNYCSGAPNSAGPGSVMSASGSVSVAANDFGLEETGGVPNAFGLFYFGPNEIDVPFGEGRRCVGGVVVRLAPAFTADSNGDASRSLDFTSPPDSTITAGSTWKFQYWYRDPAGGPSGFNLSDGLSVTFAP